MDLLGGGAVIRCDFRPTSANRSDMAPPRCQCEATHRIVYQVDPETVMLPDWRRYCRRHAEQYAGILRGLACVTAVEIAPLDAAPGAVHIPAPGALERPATGERT